MLINKKCRILIIMLSVSAGDFLKRYTGQVDTFRFSSFVSLLPVRLSFVSVLPVRLSFVSVLPVRSSFVSVLPVR